MRRILLFLFLCAAVLASWGCHRKTSVAVPAAPPPAPAESAPPAVTPPPIPKQPAVLETATIAKTITSPSNLELGLMNFHVGNYQQAAKVIEVWLSNNPKSKERDKAFFYLGLSRALANDMRQAEVALRRLISDYPGSTYRSQAEYILGLQAQAEKLRLEVKDRDERIKKLSEELQVLKEIDLQRRPSRAKE
jgi:TolA-binding protein